MQKPNLLRELCRKAEASQEQAQTVARYFEKLHFICLFILHCVALYRFYTVLHGAIPLLYCIARRYTAFYTALRGAIPYTALVRRYTALYCIARRYTVYCIVRRYTAMVSLVSSSSVTLFRVETTSPVLLSISAAQ